MWMKIPGNLLHVRLVVGEGYQTLPDTAVPCPYEIFPALPKSIFRGD
jgi:hypothetical protein